MLCLAGLTVACPVQLCSTCFGQFVCPSSGVWHCTRSNGICHTGFADSLRAGSGRATCFGHLLCPSSGDFHCTHSSGICHRVYSYSLRAGSGRNVLILLASCQQSLYDICHCCVYSGKLLMMDRGTVRNM